MDKQIEDAIGHLNTRLEQSSWTLLDRPACLISSQAEEIQPFWIEGPRFENQRLTIVNSEQLAEDLQARNTKGNTDIQLFVATPEMQTIIICLLRGLPIDWQTRLIHDHSPPALSPIVAT